MLWLKSRKTAKLILQSTKVEKDHKSDIKTFLSKKENMIVFIQLITFMARLNRGFITIKNKREWSPSNFTGNCLSELTCKPRKYKIYVWCIIYNCNTYSTSSQQVIRHFYIQLCPLFRQMDEESIASF